MINEKKNQWIRTRTTEKKSTSWLVVGCALARGQKACRELLHLDVKKHNIDWYDVAIPTFCQCTYGGIEDLRVFRVAEQSYVRVGYESLECSVGGFPPLMQQ